MKYITQSFVKKGHRCKENKFLFKHHLKELFELFKKLLFISARNINFETFNFYSQIFTFLSYIYRFV